MRVSDTERQRVIDELRRHCAAGRLDVDEYAGRIEQAHEATTLEDLDRVLADLPMMRIADPAGAGRRQHDTGRGRDDPYVSVEGSPPGPGTRLAASAVVLLSVVIVIAVVLLAVLASWAWVAVLLAGWLIGLAQAGWGRRRR